MNTASSRSPSNPSPALCKLFAQYFIVDRELKPFIEWAEQQLVEGRDTPSLRILAGLSGNDWQETEFYLRRSLQELALNWPDAELCLLPLCAEIASDILAKRIAPKEGYNRICEIACYLDYPRELSRWIELEYKSLVEFYEHEDAADGEDRVTKSVVKGIMKEATRFLALMEDYQRKTGVGEEPPGG